MLRYLDNLSEWANNFALGYQHIVSADSKIGEDFQDKGRTIKKDWAFTEQS